MKRLAFLLLLSSNAVLASDFTVEDPELVPAPTSLSPVLRAQSEYRDLEGRPCRFVGKAVSLSGAREKLDWIVTTVPACSWAASAAPILVFRREENRYRLVLAQMGYDLTIGKPSSNGLRNIAIARATAARSELGLWVYNGTTYDMKWYKGL